MDYKRSKLKDYSLVTYLSESQLQDVILRFYKAGALSHYLYIYHDKDSSVPHFHVYLNFNIGVRQSQVLLFFQGYIDEKGLDINTNIQPVFHPDAMFDYFLHNTEDCLKANKFLYDEKDLKSDNVDYFRNITPSVAEDSSGSVIYYLTDGCSLFDMIDMFGRDFIINYSKYKVLLEDLGYTYNSRLKKFVERSADL